jgi:hypothetical protein
LKDFRKYCHTVIALRLRPLPRLFLGGLALVLLLVVGIAPIFLGAKAYAYGQITHRGIAMSTSQAGATANYTVTFTPATSGTVEGMVINFCDNDPIINDSCTFSAGSPSIVGTTLASISGTSDTTVSSSHWKIIANTNSGTTGNGVILAIEDVSGTANTVSNATPVSVVFSSVINPNYSTCGTVDIHPNCTFYARMLTYAAATGVTTYTSTTVNTNVPVDAGGAALSTAAQINLTSKVQEEINFCVFSIASSGTCGDSPTVLLGNDNDVLSTAGPFVDENTEYTIQTNASNGANLNLIGNTLQANGGAFSIPGLTTGTAPATPATTSMFGLCTFETGNTGPNITITPATAYNGGTGHLCSTVTQTSGTSSTGGDGSGVQFFFDPSSPTTIGTGYGNTVASAVAGNTDTGVLAFMAEIQISQQAGIYTTAMSLIADGSY